MKKIMMIGCGAMAAPYFQDAFPKASGRKKKYTLKQARKSQRWKRQSDMAYLQLL